MFASRGGLGNRLSNECFTEAFASSWGIATLNREFPLQEVEIVLLNSRQSAVSPLPALPWLASLFLSQSPSVNMLLEIGPSESLHCKGTS